MDIIRLKLLLQSNRKLKQFYRISHALPNRLDTSNSFTEHQTPNTVLLYSSTVDKINANRCKIRTKTFMLQINSRLCIVECVYIVYENRFSEACTIKCIHLTNWFRNELGNLLPDPIRGASAVFHSHSISQFGRVFNFSIRAEPTSHSFLSAADLIVALHMTN